MNQLTESYRRQRLIYAAAVPYIIAMILSRAREWEPIGVKSSTQTQMELHTLQTIAQKHALNAEKTGHGTAIASLIAVQQETNGVHQNMWMLVVIRK